MTMQSASDKRSIIESGIDEDTFNNNNNNNVFTVMVVSCGELYATPRLVKPVV